MYGLLRLSIANKFANVKFLSLNSTFQPLKVPYAFCATDSAAPTSALSSWSSSKVLLSSLDRIRNKALVANDRNQTKQLFASIKKDILASAASLESADGYNIMRKYFVKQLEVGLDLDFKDCQDFLALKNPTVDSAIFTSFIQAACEKGDINLASQYLNELRKRNMTPKRQDYCLILHAYIKNDCQEEVAATQKIMAKMNYWPSHAAYFQMMFAYADKGDGLAVLKLLEELDSFLKGHQLHRNTYDTPRVSDYLHLFTRLALSRNQVETEEAKKRVLQTIEKLMTKTEQRDQWRGQIKLLLNKGAYEDAVSLFSVYKETGDSNLFLASLPHYMQDFEENAHHYFEMLKHAQIDAKDLTKIALNQHSRRRAKFLFNHYPDQTVAMSAKAEFQEDFVSPGLTAEEIIAKVKKLTSMGQDRQALAATTAFQNLGLTDEQILAKYHPYLQSVVAVNLVLKKFKPLDQQTTADLREIKDSIKSLTELKMLPLDNKSKFWLSDLNTKVKNEFVFGKVENQELFQKQIHERLELIMDMLSPSLRPLLLANLKPVADHPNYKLQNQMLTKFRFKARVSTGDWVPTTIDRVNEAGDVQKAITLLSQTEPDLFRDNNAGNLVLQALSAKSRGVPIGADQLLKLFQVASERGLFTNRLKIVNYLVNNFVKNGELDAYISLLDMCKANQRELKVFFNLEVLRVVLDKRPEVWPILMSALQNTSFNLHLDFLDMASNLYRIQPQIPEAYKSRNDSTLPWPAELLAKNLPEQHMPKVRILINRILNLCRKGHFQTAFNLRAWAQSLGITMGERINESLNMSNHLGKVKAGHEQEQLYSILNTQSDGPEVKSILPVSVKQACDSLRETNNQDEVAQLIGQQLARHGWEILSKKSQSLSYTPLHRWLILSNMLGLPRTNSYDQPKMVYNIAKTMMTEASKISNPSDADKQGGDLALKLWYSWLNSFTRAHSHTKSALYFAGLQSENAKLREFTRSLLTGSTSKLELVRCLAFANHLCRTYPDQFNQDDVIDLFVPAFADRAELDQLWAMLTGYSSINALLDEYESKPNFLNHLSLVQMTKLEDQTLFRAMSTKYKHLMPNFLDLHLANLKTVPHSAERMLSALYELKPKMWENLNPQSRILAPLVLKLERNGSPDQRTLRGAIMEAADRVGLTDPEFKDDLNQLNMLIFSQYPKCYEFACLIDKLAKSRGIAEMEPLIEMALFSFMAQFDFDAAINMVMSVDTLDSDPKCSQLMESMATMMMPFSRQSMPEALISVARYQQKKPLTELQHGLVTFYRLNSLLVPRATNVSSSPSGEFGMHQMPIKKLGAALLEKPLPDQEMVTLLDKITQIWGPTKTQKLVKELVELGAVTAVDQIIEWSSPDARPLFELYGQLARIRSDCSVREFQHIDTHVESLLKAPPNLVANSLDGLFMHALLSNWPQQKVHMLLQLANHIRPADQQFSLRPLRAIFADLVFRGLITGTEPIFQHVDEKTIPQKASDVDQLVLHLASDSNPLCVPVPFLGHGSYSQFVPTPEAMHNSITFVNNRNSKALPALVDHCAKHLVEMTGRKDFNLAERLNEFFKIIQQHPATKEQQLGDLCSSNTLMQIWRALVNKDALSEETGAYLTTALKANRLLS